MRRAVNVDDNGIGWVVEYADPIPIPVRDDPARYSHGEIECIDAIRAALTPEEFRGFCKGNVLKYVWRERYKGGDADLAKAKAYLGYMEGDGRCSG